MLTMMMKMIMMVMVMIIWWESCVEAASELLSHRGSFTMEGGRQKQWVQLKNMMLMPMMIELFFLSGVCLDIGYSQSFLLVRKCQPNFEENSRPGLTREGENFRSGSGALGGGSEVVALVELAICQPTISSPSPNSKETLLSFSRKLCILEKSCDEDFLQKDFPFAGWSASG